MHLGLWATDDDLTAHHVADAVAAAGGGVTWITPTGVGADATDLESWVVAGADLDACTAHIVRALPSPLVAPAGDEPARWARTLEVALARAQLSHAALAHAEARGRRVLNPVASLPFEAKPVQIEALARAGVRTPRTLCTSLPLAAERFVAALAEEGRDAIVKPVLGGATARRVDAQVRAHLGTLSDSPILVQERVDGEDIRVTIVADEVVSAVVIASDAVDYRDDGAYAAGRAQYAPLELPTAAAALARLAARTCHHVIAGVDLRRTREGEWVVLESNAAPRWLDIEQKTHAPITRAVLAALTR